MNAFSRTELLFGADAMERLAKARVAVFGVGGVGGYAGAVWAHWIWWMMIRSANPI